MIFAHAVLPVIASIYDSTFSRLSVEGHIGTIICRSTFTLPFFYIPTLIPFCLYNSIQHMGTNLRVLKLCTCLFRLLPALLSGSDLLGILAVSR